MRPYIRVGMAISKTGKLSLQGKQALRGVRKWKEWVESNGGIKINKKKYSIELIIYDDESEEEKTKTLTKKLINKDNVDILLGPYSSRLTLIASRIADNNQIVLWNHGGATDEIYQRGFDWTVGILSPSSSYFKGFLDMIKSIEKYPPKVAILYKDEGSFSPNVSLGAQKHSESLGFRVKRKKWYQPLEYPGKIVDSVSRFNPDIILGVGSFEEDVKLAKAIIESNIDIKACALIGAGIEEFKTELGKYTEGFFGVSQWEYTENFKPDFGPTPTQIQEIFGSHFPPEYTAAQSFATGLIVQRSLKKSNVGLEKREKFQKEILKIVHGLKTNTFYGKFKLEPSTGKQIGHTPFIVQWKQNDKYTVWPKEFQVQKPSYPVKI